MTPRVTVLMPVYNGGAHLGPVVESVLGQTFGDFELLVLDDASTDGSVALIDSYGDPRIRLICNERNLGQVPTLNRGLREAQGEYIARLDQDDRCRTRRLERQVELLDREPQVAVVGTWMDVVDEQGRLVWELRGRIDDFSDFVYLILVNHLPLAHPTVMFRRGPVLELGGYDPSVRFAEDQDLWRRLALEHREARVIPETLLDYLVHGGQQSQRNWEAQQEHNMRALERFVAELTRRASPRLVRLLLTWDAGFWTECRSRGDALRMVSALEALLEDAPGRLRLTSAESERLEALVRERVAIAARRSWRSGVIVHWRAGPPLSRFGRAGAEVWAPYVLAPMLRPLFLVKRAAIRAFWTSPWFQPLKARARRSGALRLLHQKLGTFRG